MYPKDAVTIGTSKMNLPGFSEADKEGNNRLNCRGPYSQVSYGQNSFAADKSAKLFPCVGKGISFNIFSNSGKKSYWNIVFRPFFKMATDS